MRYFPVHDWPGCSDTEGSFQMKASIHGEDKIAIRESVLRTHDDRRAFCQLLRARHLPSPPDA